MLRVMSQTGEDYDAPILPGDAPTDYERYLNTVALLELQKPADERANKAPPTKDPFAGR